MNKLSLSFLLYFVFTTCFCFAQQPQDFIISLSQDTLWGKIKFVTRTQKVIFKTEGTKAHFYPSSLLSFGLYDKARKDYSLYKSIRVHSQEKAFLKVLAEGKLQLFEEKTFVNGGARNLFVRTAYYVGRTAESLHIMFPVHYEGVMSHYLKEVPQVSKKLDKATFYDIPTLVAEFNQKA